MKIATFRRNLLKVGSAENKNARLAIKTISRNPLRTNILTATTSLAVNVGNLAQIAQPYLLGEAYDRIDPLAFRQELRLIGADIVRLAKFLDVKTPTASKRSRLHGTRGMALLQLIAQSTSLLQQAATGIRSVPTNTQQKTVTVPKTNKKETRQLTVVDTHKLAENETARYTQMALTLKNVISLYWSLVFDTQNHAPEALFDEYQAELDAQYGPEMFAPKAKPETVNA